MKKYIFIILCSCLCFIFGCSKTQNKDVTDVNEEKSSTVSDNETSYPNEDNKEENKVEEIIDATGNTLETRIKTPEGYTRTESDSGSLTTFIRGYSMKEDGSKVLLYNGSLKGNQSAQAAVFELPIENYDLQQCADSIMRMYAEYYWQSKQYDKIAFHFVSGFNAQYSKWIQGYRININGSNVTWTKSANADTSYESLKNYLKVVFSYASTLSMDKESKAITESEIQVGDIFIKGGSPGHVVMVVDICTNTEGKKAFLLAQGYMPAQEFHVLKNPMHEDNPWYFEDEIMYPFKTPEYTFTKGSLKRPQY